MGVSATSKDPMSEAKSANQGCFRRNKGNKRKSIQVYNFQVTVLTKSRKICR